MRDKMIKKILTIFSLSIAILIVAPVTETYSQTRASNAQIRGLLQRIETKTDAYKNAMERVLDRSQIDDTNQEDRIMELIGDFEVATDGLRDRFNSRQSISSEASNVLNTAQFVNAFMARNTLNRNVQNQWASIRTDLNTLATYYRVNWDWNGQMGGGRSGTTPPYYVGETQVRALLARIENNTDIYRRQMERSLDRSRWNDTSSEDSIVNYISNFENATDRLRDGFNSNRSVTADASEVLGRALYIDRFMRSNRIAPAAQNRWNAVRTDLNTLASYYRVSWNWNQQMPTFPGQTFPGRFDQQITGTYRLNSSLSDNVANVISRELGNLPVNQRTNLQRNLERRLRSPEMIAIQKVNSTVTMSSSNSARADLMADGVARTETNDRGRTITTTVSTNANSVMIDHEGDRVNDFYVTISPIANDRLRITRRVHLENQNETITVSSTYDKTDPVARWNVVNSQPNLNTSETLQDFYVTNGTRLTAVLQNEVDTRTSQVGDRVTMEVTSPSQYRGAIIEGRVVEADKSGRFSGRANIALDLDTIRLRDGRSFRFAGIIDSVTPLNGDNISVNNEGAIRDGSQTTQTATRAGIGAIIGAIIGAVAGGGQGAAIGAGVGAGAGAGSVLITGRDNIELETGSTFQITASAPANIGRN